MLYIALLNVDCYKTLIFIYGAYYVSLQEVLDLSNTQDWSCRAAPIEVNPKAVLKDLRGVFRQFKVSKPAAKNLSLLSLLVVLWFGVKLSPV